MSETLREEGDRSNLRHARRCAFILRILSDYESVVNR
jgi:hypothetical protein